MKQVTVSVPAKMLSSVLLLLNLASISQCCPRTLVRPANEDIHQVSVKYYNRHLCTGSLINPSYVLTVGTCFIVTRDLTTGFQDVRVVMPHPTLPISLFISSIKTIILHEGIHRDSTYFVNDICLIKLLSPQFPSQRSSFGYAKIPRYELASRYGDNVATLSGFIWVSPDSESDTRVAYGEATVYITPKQNCTEEIALTPSRLCIVDKCRKPTDCMIDPSLQHNLGGALIINGQVIGLLSRRQIDYCPSGNYEKEPAAFTYVSWYSDWILKHILEETALENRCSIGCLPTRL